ncbi:MAG: hypothetical protein JXN64_01310 [Spirochaetes bacterium]|nr:hypothetical protein [Spirochaetota bacterium]
MSFSTFKNLAASKKIITIEIDIPMKGEQNLTRLINYEPGIWFTTLTPGNIIVIDGGVISVVPNPVIDDGYDIGSVKVSGTDYVHVITFEDLRLQEESYLYDLETTKLYIHFLDYHQPVSDWAISRILIGQTTGYCDKIDSINGAYFDGRYFEPRIKNVPAISKSKDPIYFGLHKFQGGNISFDNYDGHFDKFRDANIFRQPARLKLGFDTLPYFDFWQGPGYYIENYQRDFSQFTLKLQDVRKALSMPIPPNVFTKAAYPYIDDDNVGKPKRILYGRKRNIPLVCLNETQSTSTYQFFICDTQYYPVHAVHSVYVDNELLSPGNYSVNLNTGIISISSTYVSDNLDSVTADVTGVNIKNSLAVAKDLIYNYGNISFIPANYDTREWNIAQANGREVGLCIDEQIELNKSIEKLGDASDTLIFPKDGGKYSARNYDENRTPVRRIYSDEWMDVPKISIDWSQFLSSVRIDYDKDEAEDKFRSYLNTDYEEEVFKRYKSKQFKAIETILATEAGAKSKSETIMKLSKFIPEVVKRKVKTQHIDIEIMDFIIASPHTRVGQTEQPGVWEIIGITKNLTKAEIELTMRWVKTYIEPEVLDYQQGILWGLKIFGDKLHSETIWGIS